MNKIENFYVKYGYIGFGKGVKKFSINTSEDKIKEHIEGFYNDNKMDLPVIFQAENKIIADHHNEYKCLFIDGKFCNYFAHGFQNGKWILNEKYDQTNKKHKKIVKVAKETFKWYKSKVSSSVVVRIDISFFIVKGKEHYYINEIESNPTFFFNFGVLDKDAKEHDTLEYQIELSKTLAKYCFQ